MTQVDFHFNVPDTGRYGCRLVRKAWQAGHKVVVYCEDTRRLASFDRLLWEFAPLSFIPHVSVRHPLAERTPAQSRQAARARFRSYREQGYTPLTHDVEERDGNR